MRIQLALDTVTLYEALKLAEELFGFVDIIEIGTPLIIAEGVGAVRGMRAEFAGAAILADTKIMDGGYAEAALAFEAGADIITVLGAAHDATVANAVRAAKDCGGLVMADMMAVKGVKDRAAALDVLGADYICAHTAFDLRDTGMNPLEELKQVTEVAGCAKAAAAGGINAGLMPLVTAYGPAIVIVGGAVTNAPDRKKAAKELRDCIRPGPLLK